MQVERGNERSANGVDNAALVGELIMAMMGVDRLAYIKKSKITGDYTVFAADGTELASFDTHEEAYYSIGRHNLMPVAVH